MQSKKTKIEAPRRPSTTGWRNWRIGLISVFSVVMVAVGLCTVLIFHRGTRPEIHPDVGGLVALATKLHAAETSRDGVTRVDGWPTQARFWLEWGSSTAGQSFPAARSAGGPSFAGSMSSEGGGWPIFRRQYVK
jgi:hypothetical protein